ncbi:endonuclease/exonuclease/phosphatase family protein [Streptomyces cavernicola]|uniref:Endonuclease/exonuclease/phosphatase domain-containing protein n=1 Tax=Streptomyces cavernicola TaxID=3043613 RepID=A0ABT6S575_9ACTN|nr:endonuclease/exonuclease/phosphatase family protein [Streptomyces sp. B-S-A6]MDI3403248.1 hypothetical protein [Streptomyces sp. B-S-A6]
MLLAAVMAFPAPSGASEPFAASEYQIGTFNMAGGNAEHGVKGVEAPEALVRSVQERRPAFVAVQEGCEDWSNTLRDRLSGEYAVYFDAVRRGDLSGATCRHGDVPFGNAVIVRKDVFAAAGSRAPSALSPHALSPSAPSPSALSPSLASSVLSPTVRSHELTGDVIDRFRAAGDHERATEYATKERREMLCVRSETRRLVACSAHLTHDDRDLRIAEASRAREILRDEYPGYTKLLGGDFNDDPLSATADHFYAPGYQRDAEGEFKEANSPCGNEIRETKLVRGPAGWPTSTYCRSGEATHNSGMKMDALYVPPSVEVRWSDATQALHSDHVPLWAGVML